MTDYKRLYHRLYRRVTDAILLLQTAQQECEDIYIATCDEENKTAEIIILPPNTDGA